MVNPIIPAIIGLGSGAVIGYIVASTMGAGAGARPRIDLSRYSVPAGQTYDLTCVNFPPNAQLIAPMAIYPPIIVNVGTTDSNGSLTIRGTVAQGPAGNYYIIIWNATDGKYCAVTTLTVT